MIELTKGQDATLRLIIRQGDGHGEPHKVRLTENAATSATTLTIDRDHVALSQDDVLLFGENVRVTVGSGGCAAGAVSLPVSAIAGPLYKGDELYLLQDLTAFTVAMELLSAGGDETPVLTKETCDVDVPTQSGADFGAVDITIDAADTADLTEEAYVAAVWRRNSGSARPLGRYDVRLAESGFLGC